MCVYGRSSPNLPFSFTGCGTRRIQVLSANLLGSRILFRCLLSMQHWLNGSNFAILWTPHVFDVVVLTCYSRSLKSIASTFIPHVFEIPLTVFCGRRNVCVGLGGLHAHVDRWVQVISPLRFRTHCCEIVVLPTVGLSRWFISRSHRVVLLHFTFWALFSYNASMNFEFIQAPVVHLKVKSRNPRRDD